jgi:ABC-type multidrug transport system permease subunit
MVMPIHRTEGPEWPEWKRWLIGLVATSAIFTGIWGLITQDLMQALFAAALPFVLVGACLIITLSWAVIMIPLLLFVGKVFGVKEN